MAAVALPLILSLIKAHPVVIFSQTYCPYSLEAREIFRSFNLTDDQYAVIQLDQRADGSSMKDALEELTGARSVPRVFIDGKFIGGADDTKRLHESGELRKMLENLHLIKPRNDANQVRSTNN
ncbi:Glutaredoxin-C8 [Trichinella pseudospiralis]|uniref:Glutaredoxin-2, mitochondrial n=1 Tax=Trichinella pseudospiralis TaxID=6337 RepID=A0A0V1K9B6_TRIPS|nr:Glutaredoxin-C8 [Trichinella pseudospiralis]KRY77611.1 Glutaredoxin-C8 [Trichinella pseudospiralis]KRZ30600.1 Glutaredoxin-C8 [Trichinella pseudospiralis]KRZ43809.1 Glutaredoxin-C8 [Trichinella pseudospiralis]